MRVLHTEFGDSKYRPSPLLVKMVEAGKIQFFFSNDFPTKGWYGKKNGKGFSEIKK